MEQILLLQRHLFLTEYIFLSLLFLKWVGDLINMKKTIWGIPNAHTTPLLVTMIIFSMYKKILGRGEKQILFVLWSMIQALMNLRNEKVRGCQLIGTKWWYTWSFSPTKFPLLARKKNDVAQNSTNFKDIHIIFFGNIGTYEILKSNFHIDTCH